MPDTTTSSLTPIQENVIAAITGGATMKAAAAAASIHRNTIAYWGRTSTGFRDALESAQYDKAIFIREEAENHVTDAFAAIHTILTKSDASDSARLNAAKYIIEKASTPPPPKPEMTNRIHAAPENPEIAQSPQQIGFESQNPAPHPEPHKSEIVHSNAQIGFESQNPPAPPEPQKPEIVHNNAPSTPPQTVRNTSKVGRNEPCPCGSHLKFKRCCLGKPPKAMAA
jgi:hypothetical protein